MVFGANMTPIENEWEMRKNLYIFFFICQKIQHKLDIFHTDIKAWH